MLNRRSLANGRKKLATVTTNGITRLGTHIHTIARCLFLGLQPHWRGKCASVADGMTGFVG